MLVLLEHIREKTGTLHPVVMYCCHFYFQPLAYRISIASQRKDAEYKCNRFVRADITWKLRKIPRHRQLTPCRFLFPLKRQRFINRVWGEGGGEADIYIYTGSLCIDFSVLQCSIRRSRAWYMLRQGEKTERLYFHPYKPVSWLLTHQSRNRLVGMKV